MTMLINRNQVPGPTPVGTPPAVPDLTASPSAGAVIFSWTSLIGATSYQYRTATTMAGVTAASSVTTTAVSVVVATGVTLYGQVRSGNSYGWSAWSVIKSAVPSAAVPTTAPDISASPGTTSVKFLWDTVTSATSYDYRTAASSAGVATATIVNTTGLSFSVLNVTATQYAQARSVNSAGSSAWSAIVSATPVGIPGSDPINPPNFNVGSWDFVANTGPRVAPATTMVGPAFSYAANSTVSHSNVVKGNMSALHILPVALPYSSTNKSKSTDYPTCLNIEGWALQAVDCNFELGVVMTALPSGSTAVAQLQYCRVDNTVSVGPQQGGMYRYTGDFDCCELFAFQDGLWNGEYTRPIVYARYTSGDFSSPYASRVRYSWMHMDYAAYGNSTYSPTYYNISSEMGDYPLSETDGTLAPPITQAEITNSVIPSINTTTAANVGDFVAPAGDATVNTGTASINGGRWQIIGSTGSDRSPNAAVTIGTDFQSHDNGSYQKKNADGTYTTTPRTKGWLRTSTTWRNWTKGEVQAATDSTQIQPFVSGTAILIWLGGDNHSDASQMGHANGHVLYYRSKFDQFTNAGTIIPQPTNAPANGVVYTDPAYWPTSYLRIEECLVVVVPSRSRIAYAGYDQNQVTDSVAGTTDLPIPYGYKANPWWVTFINNQIGGPDQASWTSYAAQGDYNKVYYDSKGRSPVFVASEAKRFDCVMAQLDPTGVSMMTAANGGTMPTGAQLVSDGATGTLQSTLRQVEYQSHIYLATDGYNGLPDNITNMAVFQNRLAAKLRKADLDARSWIVWQNNTDRWLGTPIDATIPSTYRSKNPWLALDGSDGGYYTGP